MATLDDWRAQEGDRDRYPFAAPEEGRCEAVRQPGRDIFGQADDTIYRCGKQRGHDATGDRHACSDNGVTLKW